MMFLVRVLDNSSIVVVLCERCMYEMMAFLAGAVLFIMQYQEPYCCLSFIYYYAFLLESRYSVE